MLKDRFKQSRTLLGRQAYDLSEEVAELPPAAERGAILQDLPHDWANSPGLQSPTESMNFIELCFVAMTVAGFAGLTATIIWMWLI
jgi:hypothetical protein